MIETSKDTRQYRKLDQREDGVDLIEQTLWGWTSLDSHTMCVRMRVRFDNLVGKCIEGEWHGRENKGYLSNNAIDNYIYKYHELEEVIHETCIG